VSLCVCYGGVVARVLRGCSVASYVLVRSMICGIGRMRLPCFFFLSLVSVSFFHSLSGDFSGGRAAPSEDVLT